MEPAAPVSSPDEGDTQAPEALVFALGALRGRSRVGAVAPASPWLARAIALSLARAVPAARDEAVCALARSWDHGTQRRWHTVVEVGAGTGALTRAILARPRVFERFVAIERDPKFAVWLGRRFPGIEVIRGCASQVVQVIEPGVPTAIVSSLPFRSMSRPESARCIGALVEALGLSAQSVLIQYSYGFGDSPPFAVPSNGLRWSVAQRVMLNLPPATVWTLKHIDSPDP
jgi:phosphatidylethanolamine/phosphatidyl-N-methylethanolamine N-methyltransferase